LKKVEHEFKFKIQSKLSNLNKDISGLKLDAEKHKVVLDKARKIASFVDSNFFKA